MNDLEYESTLVDRIAKIQAINEQYDLENNGYISCSGGLDSMVVSKLFDVALPNNKIPRIYFNTGIEYKTMVDFVKSIAEKDSRFKIIPSGVNIKKMLDENGYPFKSKQHSHNWSLYYNNNNNEIDSVIDYLNKNPEMQKNYDYIHNLPKGVKTNIKYIFGLREKTTKIEITDKPINENSKLRDEWGMKDYITDFGIIEKETRNSVVERESSIVNSMSILTCPDKLRYQFTKEFKNRELKFSDKCCYKLKKETALRYEEESNRRIAITGIRGEEGGMRAINGCTIFNEGKLKRFHPIKVVSNEWESEFIKRNNVELCPLYYPPYNFRRTGCVACPYGLEIQEELNNLYKYLPNEYYKAIRLWKPVYDEYIRIGYRMNCYPHERGIQMTIDDFLDEKE